MLMLFPLQSAVASSSAIAASIDSVSRTQPSSRRLVNPPSNRPNYVRTATAANSSSTSITSISSAPSYPSTSQTLRPSVDFSQDVLNARSARQRATEELNYYFEELRGYCPIHFGYHQELKRCTDWQCDRFDDFAEWTRYPNFKSHFRFAKYTYCYECGAPNNSGSKNYFALPVHKPFPLTDRCEWAHFVYRTIFAVWHRADISPVLCEGFDAPAHDLDRFAQWASHDPSDPLATQYFNGLAFFMAYCRGQTDVGGTLEHMSSLVERFYMD